MNADPDDLKYVSEAELASVREQIQEDIICYVEAVGGEEENADALCQIVVNNFKRL